MNKNAKWISHPTAKDEAVYIRKTFNIENTPHTAKVDICGVGMYELYINGKKADDRMLTPPFTPYNRQVMYDTYEISHLLQNGKNVIGIILASGFYNFTINDMIGFDHSEWRGIPRLICELSCNGESVVVSDTSFKMSLGAIVYNHIYIGEVYDARLEKPWAEVDFDDSDWVKPIISRPPGGVLEASDNMPIRITDIIDPVDSWQLEDGTRIYDFGKNMSGFVSLSGKGMPGTGVTFKYSEKLDPDTRDLDTSNISPYIFSDNFQTDTYIFGDKPADGWHPRFNYQGFRYVKVINEDNADIEIKAAFLRADIKPAGFFRCSNDLINKIQDAAYQATISNFHYFPTDCPHREKLGWTGDAQVSAEQALFNLDIKDFYTQWLRMYPAAQRDSGHIPATIPRPGCCSVDGFEGPVWDSAMFVIPWNIYMYTGDTRAIEAVYDACKRYLDYAYTCSDNYIISIGNGDWPVYGDRFTSKEISVTGYYYI
ncbi:MAG: family 78 glycoside hydrolase catalytic domain, partial [Clostridia bacterium]|nr:family 78 glycoside hydrolase catalytic domain [Clostridia bacterium]